MAQDKGGMSVSDAGRKGGKKGGLSTKKKYGHDFYEESGHKGGRRVRELVEEGKRKSA
jgi:uncharacterized protein